MVEVMSVDEYNSGDILGKQGEEVPGFFCIMFGNIVCHHKTDTGTVTSAKAQMGNWMGERALFGPVTLNISMVTNETTKLAKLTRDEAEAVFGSLGTLVEKDEAVIERCRRFTPAAYMLPEDWSTISIADVSPRCTLYETATSVVLLVEHIPTGMVLTVRWVC